VRLLATASRPFGWLLGSKPVQKLLQSRVDAAAAGPTEVQRAQGLSLVWGEVTDDTGHKRAARLEGPEGYTLTAQTALAAVARVLNGQAPAGYQTPAKAYGSGFILEMDGTTRIDVPSLA